MSKTREHAIAPQPYPARPQWAGDFHRLEAALFADREVVDRRADDFAETFVPGRARGRRKAMVPADHYVLMQIPDLPSLRIDLSMLQDD
jgi:hypothetical protein